MVLNRKLTAEFLHKETQNLREHIYTASGEFRTLEHIQQVESSVTGEFSKWKLIKWTYEDQTGSSYSLNTK